MSTEHFGCVAALLFSPPPRKGFADLLSHLRTALAAGGLFRDTGRVGDYTALLRHGDLRMALRLSPHRRRGSPWYLIVAIGSVEGSASPVSAEVCQRVLRRAVTLLQEDTGCDRVISRAADGPVDRSLTEAVLADLERLQDAADRAPAGRPRLLPPWFRRAGGYASARGRPAPGGASPSSPQPPGADAPANRHPHAGPRRQPGAPSSTT